MGQSSQGELPLVVADGPLAPAILERLAGKVALLPWRAIEDGPQDEVVGLYTYGHPQVDGALLDQFPRLKVISNYGVGVDHICLDAARQRNIPVGNTPGVLDGATADMAFALLLASARRVVEGDRYARSPAFTAYDPGYMLGREVHHATIGIVGMGRIGLQIAKRAAGFDMRILYHNRRERTDLPPGLNAQYVSLEDLLRQADYVVLSVPLTSETRGLIDSGALAKMKQTATLVNVSRGPVVVTDDLVTALATKQIAAAAFDVTDPEPLPRNHPLLAMDNLVLVPHLGSATVQTRERMAEMSVENLMAGLNDQPLPWRIA